MRKILRNALAHKKTTATGVATIVAALTACVINPQLLLTPVPYLAVLLGLGQVLGPDADKVTLRRSLSAAARRTIKAAK